MNDFSLLSDEEFRKICSAIPLTYIVGYFKKNSKEFSKIRPGFRAASIQSKDAIKLLVSYRERRFISSFVEKIANGWIQEIDSAIQKYQENGDSEIAANIHALYQSFFADNISAYFKLIDKNYTEEQLDMMSSMIFLLKKEDADQQKNILSINETIEKINFIEKKTDKSDVVLKQAAEQISSLTAELQALSSIRAQSQNLLTEYRQLKDERDQYASQINKLSKQITELSVAVEKLKNDKSELEVTIKAIIEEEKENTTIQFAPTFPLSPIDMDEFKEYLMYNFESIDINGTHIQLLSSYISNILFQGRPIICNKCYLRTLVNCISNTLVGNKSTTVIEYTPDIDVNRICAALANSERIVILDNFLGNYNETILLSLLEHFKSKIIFLSETYERTLFYIPKDFLLYCNYINLSHIPSFIKSLELDEDPSVLEEKEVYYNKSYNQKNRYQNIAVSIATELRYSVALTERIVEFIDDDLSLCGMLLFNIIPYMNDVLCENPFNISVSLQKYVTRCPYKTVFEEWFMS